VATPALLLMHEAQSDCSMISTAMAPSLSSRKVVTWRNRLSAAAEPVAFAFPQLVASDVEEHRGLAVVVLRLVLRLRRQDRCLARCARSALSDAGPNL
jgi:hypothetical protein